MFEKIQAFNEYSTCIHRCNVLGISGLHMKQLKAVGRSVVLVCICGGVDLVYCMGVL